MQRVTNVGPYGSYAAYTIRTVNKNLDGYRYDA